MLPRCRLHPNQNPNLRQPIDDCPLITFLRSFEGADLMHYVTVYVLTLLPLNAEGNVISGMSV